MANYTWTFAPKYLDRLSGGSTTTGAWNSPISNSLASSANTSSTTYLQLAKNTSGISKFMYSFDIKVASNLTPNAARENERVFPQNAVINSVECAVRICCSNTGFTQADVQLYCGKTAKDSPSSFINKTGSTNVETLVTGTWTVDELKDLRLVIIGKNNTSELRYVYVRGATLVINWSDPDGSLHTCLVAENNSDSIADWNPNYNGAGYNCRTGQTFDFEFYPYTKDAERFFITNGNNVTETKIPKTGLTYHQEREYTVTLNPIIMSYSDVEVHNANDACTGTTPNTYAYVDDPGNTDTGVSNTKHVRYVFDTSSIPANARIVNVTCDVRCMKGTYNRFNCQVGLFGGDTLKSYYSEFMGPSDRIIHLYSNTGTTWTRDEINAINLKVTGYRAATGTGTTYMFRIYGADLNITYAVDKPYYSYSAYVDGNDIIPRQGTNYGIAYNIKIYNDSHTKDDGTWKGLKGAYKKVNDVWEPIPNLDTELQDKVLVGDKYLEMPFTIEMKQGGQISWSRPNGKTVQYSKNGSDWDSWNTNEELWVSSGDIIRIKGTHSEYSGNILSCTGNFDVYGNIMSLIYGDDFVDEKELVSANTFYGLFSGDTKLVSAKNLRLPATTLADDCYHFMFRDCTSLTSAPELPATTLADYCYYSMFLGCASLTSAPELPATTLAEYCYYYMFTDCTSLTTTPELPATTLEYGCYYGMFRGCTGLTSTPELPATTLAFGCYQFMFRDCISLTGTPSLPATTLASQCYTEMFRNCTGLTSTPVLPATTLGYACYSGMFRECTNLKYATSLPATILQQSCYYNMFGGCTSLTNAPVLPATTLVGSCYYGMFSGCTSLIYIKAMFTTTPSTSYTQNWVSGVAASGTFVKNVSATWTTTGVDAVPVDWTTRTENQ